MDATRGKNRGFAERGRDAPPPAERLELPRFFPYRLAVLAHDVSRAISQLYTDRFDLSRQEWRVLAALGDRQPLSATEIADYSTLEKMQVSRAVDKLLRAGLVVRRENPEDRRHLHLRLSRKGMAMYRKIVPLVRAREDYILSALDAEERQTLERLMERVHARSRDLLARG